MSTIVVPTVNSIAVDNRRPAQFMATLVAALGYHVGIDIRTVSDLIERRFAEFAGVPYPGPLTRQQWEELWEMESELPVADRDLPRNISCVVGSRLKR